MDRITHASSGLYHLTISLAGKTCLIAGFGSVGQRKLQGLLRTNTPDLCVHIFDPHPDLPRRCEPFQKQSCTLILHQEAADEVWLEQAWLVFACTSNLDENIRIARFCEAHHILCNCAAPPAAGDVTLPATIEHAPVTLTISTAGASPALSRKWHAELEDWVLRKQPLARLMAWLRPDILSLGHPQQDNKALFTALAESPLEDWLADGDLARASDYLKAALPAQLTAKIPELLSQLKRS